MPIQRNRPPLQGEGNFNFKTVPLERVEGTVDGFFSGNAQMASARAKPGSALFFISRLNCFKLWVLWVYCAK